MTVMLFLGAMQLIAIGILGEYIARIFNEAKNRPTYLINEYKKHTLNDNLKKKQKIKKNQLNYQ